jgi:hypothetical protein
MQAEIITDVLTKIPDFWAMTIGIQARMFLRSLLLLSSGCTKRVLKMMAVSSSEKLVPIFQTPRRLIAGAWNLQLVCCSTDSPGGL